MFKRLILMTMLVSPCLYADWIDDLAQHAHGKNLDVPKSIKVIEEYIKKDEQDIKELEKKLASDHKQGLVASLRDEGYKVKREVAKSTLAHHMKVLIFLKTLPKNEKIREKFAVQLSNIRVSQDELALLKEEGSKTSTVSEASKNVASIAAKELYVKGLKTVIHTSFFLS